MSLKTRINRLLAESPAGSNPRPVRVMAVESDETEAEAYLRHFGEQLTPEAEDKYFIIALVSLEPGGVPHEIA